MRKEEEIEKLLSILDENKLLSASLKASLRKTEHGKVTIRRIKPPPQYPSIQFHFQVTDNSNVRRSERCNLQYATKLFIHYADLRTTEIIPLS